jgi:hypothetical protein
MEREKVREKVILCVRETGELDKERQRARERYIIRKRESESEENKTK